MTQPSTTLARSAPAGDAPRPPDAVEAVTWEDGAAVIIDQRRLPAALVRWRLADVPQVVEAIRSLAVRGAPAIGIAGAYGMVTGLIASGAPSPAALVTEAVHLQQVIGTARPTAVNLGYATRRVRLAVEDAAGDARATTASVLAAALQEARAIHAQDADACASIGRHGAALLSGDRRVLTHCNTGRLATGGDGTALAIAYALASEDRLREVLVDETRPLLQGARLTAWELGRAGIAHRVLADGAAGSALAHGMADVVIVGCDRVAANGDTANKVGTYPLAVLAARHGVPFLVAGPLSSFDATTPDGAAIEVEERAPTEVLGFGGMSTTPPGSGAWNPAFDVTPAELVTAFVTEVGVLRPPFGPAIGAALDGIPAAVDGHEVALGSTGAER
ncbi:MAG: S-methyl-5-thioribose-1-phosphate isomerase [Chloroflexi bacterium]|nr:S-methyl-5-thioribose-1-phosphate isomerase [Chloroflexota bacterium]